MTILQDKLAKEILTSKTMREAGLKAGYSEQSRQVYKKHTKIHIAKILAEQGVTKESLTEAYNECLRLCKNKQDYSTLKATIDSIARLHNFLRDNNIQQVQVNVNDILTELSKPKPIDVTTSQSKS